MAARSLRRRPGAARLLGPTVAACVLLSALLVLALVPPASAHAEYVNSSPAPYQIWTFLPTVVYVTVSEAVQPGSQALVVTNARGVPVDIGPTNLSADQETLSVHLENAGPSVYTVIWSVISSDDGHFTTGYFYFMVQAANGTLPGAFPTSPPPGFGATPGSQPIPPLEVLLRGLLFVGFAILFGGLAFLLLVWSPSLSHLDADARRDAHRGTRAVLRIARLGGLVFLAGLVGLWADALVGTSLQGLGSLVGSPFLVSIVARIPLAVGMLVMVTYAILRPDDDAGAAMADRDVLWALGMAFVAMGAEALTSHSADYPAWLPLGPLADAMHLYGAALWVGGLLALIAVRSWVRRPETPAFSATVLTTFSRQAAVAVGLLVLGGVVLEVILVGSLYALLTQPYGWTVLAKSLLLVPMLVLAWANHRRVPRIARGEDAERRKAHRVVRGVQGELLLGVTILVAAALLTAMYPPTEPPQSPYLSESATRDGFFALFQVFPVPAAPGPYLFTIQMWLAANGSPYIGMYNATATLAIQRMGGGALTSQTMLGPHGPNHWYVNSSAMDQPGTYAADITFTRPGEADVSFSFQVTVYTPFYVPFLVTPPRG